MDHEEKGLKLLPGPFLAFLNKAKKDWPELSRLVLPETLEQLIMRAFYKGKLNGVVRFELSGKTSSAAGRRTHCQMYLADIPVTFTSKLPYGRSMYVMNGGTAVKKEKHHDATFLP